jgi:hypothetical protein
VSGDLYVYDFVVPAITPTSAPVSADLIPRGSYRVTKVTIVIPAGHGFLTGVALGYGQQIAIPINQGGWISGDHESYSYELNGYPDGVAWQAFGCNNDVIAHSFQVRMEVFNLGGGGEQRVLRPIDFDRIVTSEGVLTYRDGVVESTRGYVLPRSLPQRLPPRRPKAPRR